ADVMRAAKANVRYHLAYIGWLAQTRNFLAGDRLSYADLAAAAHLSAIDYLGDVPWSEDDAAKAWYARVKSRPSFRPLLSEWLAGVPASSTAPMRIRSRFSNNVRAARSPPMRRATTITTSSKSG